MSEPSVSIPGSLLDTVTYMVGCRLAWHDGPLETTPAASAGGGGGCVPVCGAAAHRSCPGLQCDDRHCGVVRPVLQGILHRAGPLGDAGQPHHIPGWAGQPPCLDCAVLLQHSAPPSGPSPAEQAAQWRLPSLRRSGIPAVLQVPVHSGAVAATQAAAPPPPPAAPPAAAAKAPLAAATAAASPAHLRRFGQLDSGQRGAVQDGLRGSGGVHRRGDHRGPQALCGWGQLPRCLPERLSSSHAGGEDSWCWWLLGPPEAGTRTPC
jgi:hypothetical protein